MKNVIKINGNIHVFNGGDPIKDCPKNWDDAKKWIEEANKDKDEHLEPTWSFDCGFKLDFDGSILSAISRFYPPKTDYGNDWDGSIDIYLLKEKIRTKKFKCNSLLELKMSIDNYMSCFVESLKKHLNQRIPLSEMKISNIQIKN